MGSLDRRKHDVDVIERVLGGIRDAGNGRTHIMDVEVPWVSGSANPTLELVVGIDDGDDDDEFEPRR